MFKILSIDRYVNFQELITLSDMVKRSVVLGLIYKTRHRYIREIVNIVFTYPYMDIYIYCNRENSQSPFLDKHSLSTPTEVK